MTEERQMLYLLYLQKANKKPWIYRLVSLALLPGKTMEQILSGAASEHMNVKKVTRTSQHVQPTWLP